jgi:hypothetical protein
VQKEGAFEIIMTIASLYGSPKAPICKSEKMNLRQSVREGNMTYAKTIKIHSSYKVNCVISSVLNFFCNPVKEFAGVVGAGKNSQEEKPEKRKGDI